MRVLTQKEMRQVEQWARKTKIADILSFFDELPRFIHIPKPLLLGSINDNEILVVGDTTTSRVQGLLANLDEPFNPYLKLRGIYRGIKREKPVGVVQSIHQRLKKGFPELCLLKDSGQCGQKIVRAHSVQKSLFKNHSKNGHIYQFKFITGTRDADERLWPDLIGINEATTFTGFCDYHDSQVFSPIDNSLFQNTPEHKFLHHYRAFAQSYYGKAHKFRIIESALKEVATKLPFFELNSLMEKLRLNQQDVRELESIKSNYDHQLRKENWSALEGYVFVGESMPDVFMTEYFAPRKNFNGHIIQDYKSFSPLNWISMTVTASNGKALLLLCGEKGCPVLRELTDSFRKLPTNSQTAAIVEYVFCHCENFILLPRWWESLSEEIQLKFVNAFLGRYYPRKLPITCDWKLSEI